jgi:hypothetical protein
LYKRHPRTFTLVPTAQGILLHLNGASKEVMRDLHNQGICLSKESTVQVMDALIDRHVSQVQAWKGKIEVSL